MGSRPTAGGSHVDPRAKELKTKGPAEGGLSVAKSILASFEAAQDLASINPSDRTGQDFCKSIGARYGDARPDRTQAGQ